MGVNSLLKTVTRQHCEWKHADTTSYITHTHTHIRLTALCPGLPGWAGTRKVKPIWILLKQETVSGSGISWTICKSAPRSRQITMPAPHHSVFLQARCPCCCPTNSVKALKATTSYITLSTNAVGINGSLCLCIDSQKKLVTWLRILLRNTWLIEYYYQPWSYVVKTGKSRLIIMTRWFIFVSYIYSFFCC